MWLLKIFWNLWKPQKQKREGRRRNLMSRSTWRLKKTRNKVIFGPTFTRENSSNNFVINYRVDLQQTSIVILMEFKIPDASKILDLILYINAILQFFQLYILHSVWKLLKLSYFILTLLAFSTNFCLIKNYLSGNTVWLNLQVFKKVAIIDNFRHF